MNLFAPVSSLMTGYDKLVTVTPEESLARVKEIFDTHTFHHIPVVHFREIVGIISKSDFEFFMGAEAVYRNELGDAERFNKVQAKDLMTKRLGKVESTDRLNVAVEIFTINYFHALPVVDNGELTGIITPFDILKALAREKAADPSMVYENTVAL